MSGIMNAAANKSSPIGRLVPVLLVLAGLIGLYYLYQYLFGPKSTNAYTLISGTQSANIDPSKPITITSDKLPIIYEGGEFTISTWIYVTNWSYRTGFNKSIISVGGPNFDTIRVYLGGNKPKLSVRLQTKDMSGAMNAVPSGATAINVNLGATKSQVPVESLDKGTQNATFGILQTDSGLLDGSPLCDLPEIDLQRWVCITVSVNGRTVDVYMDGKLSRSCVLDSLFMVDGVKTTVKLGGDKGFGGLIGAVYAANFAYSPDQVYKKYQNGPFNLTWFSSLMKIFDPSQWNLDIKLSKTNTR